MASKLVGVQTLLTMKGGCVARGLELGLRRMASDIAVAADVKDWRTLTLKIRSRPDPETGCVITEVILPSIKLSERVTSFVGDVKRDGRDQYAIFADDEMLCLVDEEDEASAQEDLDA